MAISATDRERALRINPPSSRAVRKALVDYMARTGLVAADVAARVGYSRVAVIKFLAGSYAPRLASTDLYIRADVWDYLQRHPIRPAGARATGRIFATENARRIRQYFLRAVEHGEVALLYGPPGTQKTFVLEHLLAERHAAAKSDAVYVYASDEMRPLALFRRIARAAGALVIGGEVERLLTNLLHEFSQRERPPAVVVDEAQHLPIHSLELLRELHDRCGCGLVLAGSHNLHENFLRGRSQLEQWLSRIDYKEPLPGLSEEEVAQIAARDLGNGQPKQLSKTQVGKIVRACRVEDVFARGADGRPEVCEYLSVRRLVKTLAQLKEAEA